VAARDQSSEVTLSMCRLDPPAIILSRQLPLFLAELQAFDQPQQGRKAEVIFGLYEKTARLFSLWDDVLPKYVSLTDLGKIPAHQFHSTPCDFDMDAFFEPHVMEWLKATEEVDTHDWVSQAVGMDSVSLNISQKISADVLLDSCSGFPKAT
jgi:hypothetical protein